MFKITRGDETFTALTYMQAEKLFRRVAKRKYPCGSFTRMYCDIGNGFQLIKVTGNKIENALKPEH